MKNQIATPFPLQSKIMAINESIVEEAAIEWFGELGYSYLPGPEIAPDEVEE